MKKTNEAKILLNAGGLAAKELAPFLKVATGLEITDSVIHNRKRSGKYELLSDAQRSDLRSVVANPESPEEMIFAESVRATALYLNQLLVDTVPRDELALDDEDLEPGDANGELDLGDDDGLRGDPSPEDLDDDLAFDPEDEELELDDEEELNLDDDDLDDDLGLDDDDLDDDLGLDDDADMPTDDLDDDLGLDDDEELSLDDEETDPLDDLLGGDDELSTDDLLGDSESLNDSDDDLDFDL